MKEQTLKISTTPTKEIYIETPTLNVSIYPWSNCEGVSLLVHGKGQDLPIRMSGSFTWGEIQAIQAALAAAQI